MCCKVWVYIKEQLFFFHRFSPNYGSSEAWCVVFQSSLFVCLYNILLSLLMFIVIFMYLSFSFSFLLLDGGQQYYGLCEALYTGHVSCLMSYTHIQISFSSYTVKAIYLSQTSFPLGVVKLKTGSNLTNSANPIIWQPAPGAAHFYPYCSPTWAQLKLTPDQCCQDQFLDKTWFQNWLSELNKSMKKL